ncbi:aquaporin-like protein [Dichomitus squalens]|uniref:Aquaporin-like protein n=1 Tax=Dichomitus squalens TaxID=114155 RepID=A0A4Q9MR51_9APHY|nr:aquaporin-like protein [Dichomitus squalens]
MLRSRLSRERDFIHLADVKPRLNAQIVWERRRRRNVHWLAECAAEFVGTFIYVFAGIGSAAAFRLNTSNAEGLSSVLQIGIGYAIGVVLAFVTQPTSGGHYNPGVSIAFAIMRRISPQKALRYIVAQILGAYCACLLIYVQYGDAIKQVEAELSAAGTLASTLFTPSGPAGVFAIYLAPGTSFGRVFLNEFVCDFVIGLVIWAVDDPSNHNVSPVAAPWIIAFVFALMVWSYSSVGVATNTARDIGARLMAITIWGLEAGGGPYAAITALTNILATSLAAVFYELVFADYSRVLTPASADLLAAQVAYNEHASRTVAVTELERDVSPDDKAIEQTLERV